jgi:secretion/DNA translocation related CpaE-like protein
MPQGAVPAVRRIRLAATDREVIASVRRVAAVAGLALVELTPGDRPGWSREDPLVADLERAAALPAAGGPTRGGLLLATADDPDADAWRVAVQLGADAVLTVPREERQLLDWLAGAADSHPEGRLVCCLPGRGGAGASTLAAALALAAAAGGATALLVDADPAGGGQDLLVGIEHRDGVRWPEVTAAAELDPAGLAAAVPSIGGVGVLSCSARQALALAPAVLDAVLTAGLRGHDVVVADLPQQHDQAAAVALARAQSALVVVPAEVRAAAAAGGVVDLARAACADVRLVVRSPGPGDLRPRDVAEAAGAPVAAVWPWDRRLAAAVDAGTFAARWRRTTAGAVARRLSAELFARAAA